MIDSTNKVFASGQAIREASLTVLRPTAHGSETSRTQKHSLYGLAASSGVLNPRENKVSISSYIILIEVFLIYISFSSALFFSFTANYFVYIHLFFLFLLILLNINLYFNIYFIAFLSLNIIYMMITTKYNNGGYGSVVTFSSSILTLYVLSNLDVHRIVLKNIAIISSVFAFYLLYLSFKYSTNFYLFRFNDINPNVIGIFSLYCYCILYSFNIKPIHTLSFYNFLFVFLAIFTMINCKSRGALISLFSFIMLNICPSKLFSPLRTTFATLSLIILSAIFPFFYTDLYQSSDYTTIYFDEFDKTLFTGRELIWFNALDLFGNEISKWLFGLGSKAVLWDYETNAHNNYFGYIINFGIIGALLYLIYICIILRPIVCNINKDPQIKTLFTMYVSTVVILGFTETSVFWSVLFIFSNLSIARAYYLSKKGYNDSSEN